MRGAVQPRSRAARPPGEGHTLKEANTRSTSWTQLVSAHVAERVTPGEEAADQPRSHAAAPVRRNLWRGHRRRRPILPH
jgi:hypothetical protein